jgi:putative phosphoesterase
MDLAIVADTHVPSREPAVPDWVVEHVEAADHVVHVGDFDAPEVLERFREWAPALTAVHGNMDPATLELPSVATLDVEGVRFVVTHGTGDPEGYRDRVVGVARDHAAADLTTVAVGGHVHQVLDETRDGVRLLNPGSATGASPAEAATMLTASVADGGVDVTVHREDG